MVRRFRSLVLLLGLGLGAIPATLFAEALPPVYFNHVTIFIPPAAYDALRQSSFLRNEFSGFQEHTVQRDGGKWSYTGIYIFGQHTYLEFFKAGQDQPHFGTTIAGQVVFNMWIDDRAQLPRFKERLAAEQRATLLIDTARDAKNQPMYDTVVSKGGPAGDFGPGMRVDTHLKGYYPDGITREKRLEGRFLAQRQLHDMTGFTLTVDEAERNRLINQFRAYSYDIRADGAKQVVSGREITFTLVAAKSHEPRTMTIDFSMNRTTTGEQTYKLDDGGEIQIQGSIGKWAFTFPNE
jgi:Family of unknown function (DUF5829)